MADAVELDEAAIEERVADAQVRLRDGRGDVHDREPSTANYVFGDGRHTN